MGVVAPAHGAQTFPGAPPIEQLARGADVVVLGDVTATAGEWDAGRANIQTRVHLDVLEVLKGTAPSAVSFTQLGGRVGDRISAVGGAARFEPGERVLVFLARGSDGSLRLGNLIHGKLRVQRDAATGGEYVVRVTGAAGAVRIELDQVRAHVRRAGGDQG